MVICCAGVESRGTGARIKAVDGFVMNSLIRAGQTPTLPLINQPGSKTGDKKPIVFQRSHNPGMIYIEWYTPIGKNTASFGPMGISFLSSSAITTPLPVRQKKISS